MDHASRLLFVYSPEGEPFLSALVWGPGLCPLSITTATAIEVVMIFITTFSFPIIRLVWMFACHLGNDLLLLIRLPLLVVDIELIL
jgi:hypothetical protein